MKPQERNLDSLSVLEFLSTLYAPSIDDGGSSLEKIGIKRYHYDEFPYREEVVSQEFPMFHNDFDLYSLSVQMKFSSRNVSCLVCLDSCLRC